MEFTADLNLYESSKTFKGKQEVKIERLHICSFLKTRGWSLGCNFSLDIAYSCLHINYLISCWFKDCGPNYLKGS